MVLVGRRPHSASSKSVSLVLDTVSYFTPCMIFLARLQPGRCRGISVVVSGGPVHFPKGLLSGLRGKRKKKQGADRHHRPRVA